MTDNSADTTDTFTTDSPFDEVHETRSLPAGLFGKSPILRAVIVAVIDKNQRQIAETAAELLKLTTISLFLWWTTTEILAPLVVDQVGLLSWAVLNLSVGILPAIGAICGVLAVAHALWYARVRWKARPPADSERGDD